MDLDSAEDHPAVKIGFGLAVVVLWLGIGFYYVLNVALTKVGTSINRGFLVVNDVDSIIDGLDRLILNQRSFFRTGDLQFSQDVYESITRIQRHMDSLLEIARKGSSLHGPIGQLARSVDVALGSLEKASEIEKSGGPAVAIKRLDEDQSIADAEMEAEQLRKLAEQGVFDSVRQERKMKSVLDALL